MKNKSLLKSELDKIPVKGLKLLIKLYNLGTWIRPITGMNRSELVNELMEKLDHDGKHFIIDNDWASRNYIPVKKFRHKYEKETKEHSPVLIYYEAPKQKLKLKNKKEEHKVEHKEEPKVEPKEEPKVQPKEEQKMLVLENTLKKYEKIIKFLKSPSKRNETYLNNLGLTNEELQNIFYSQKLDDFYPTPMNCILEVKNDLKNSFNILEPTCGLGFTILLFKIINPHADITAYEYNYNITKVANKLLAETGLKVERKDFFDVSDKNNYDYIFLNPPFTSGIKKKDKYYFKFLIKLFKVMAGSKKSITSSFICPKNILPNNIKVGDSFSVEDIFYNVSKTELKKYLDSFNMTIDDLNDILPILGRVVSKCNFETTKFEIYHLQFATYKNR